MGESSTQRRIYYTEVRRRNYQKCESSIHGFMWTWRHSKRCSCNKLKAIAILDVKIKLQDNIPDQWLLPIVKSTSDELRNGALQIWRGVVCFSRDFTFRINILNSISTPHKHSFFIITNVLSVSRDLPHPFLTFYFNPNLHHFINNTCNLIHFLSMTIDTKFMELIGVFLNYLRFVNYNVSC